MASSDEDRTRFFRLSLVILEELTTILRDLLHKEICPSQIFNKVKQQKLKQLSHAQLVLIQNAKFEGFTKFDITLLCTLLRNYCPNIQQPTQSWTMTEMPAQNEMTLGDDIVRIRLIKNKYVSHIHEAAISETEFKELWSIISDICTRMQTRLPNTHYVLKLEEAQYRTIDSATENLYMDKIKELADEDETNYKKILNFIEERELTSNENITIKAKTARKEKLVETLTDISICILNEMVDAIHVLTPESDIEQLYISIEDFIKENKEHIENNKLQDFLQELAEKIKRYAKRQEGKRIKILARFMRFSLWIKKNYGACVESSKGSLILTVRFSSQEGYDLYTEDLEKGIIGQQILELILYPPYLASFDLQAEDLVVFLNGQELTQDSDEMTRRLRMKSEVWENLKKTLKALKEPKNVLLLGSFGTGKSSFINTVITTLTGKSDYYVDIGCGRFQRISREDYWNPDEEVDKTLNLPTFIDIIGMEPLLSTSEDEETVNSQIMNLAINGKLPENADLLDLGRKLKDKKQIKERPEEKMLTVDIIIVVISAENSEIPQALIDEIYKEANVKKKQIPVFAVITKVDKCDLSEQELENKKTEICEAIGIASDKVLMCSNYQPNQPLDTDKDISILEFMTKLCNPRFKAVTLQKMECEESEPELQPAPVPASTPSKNENESSFGIKLLQGVFVVLVIAILLGMILHLLSKDSLRGSRKSFQGGSEG